MAWRLLALSAGGSLLALGLAGEDESRRALALEILEVKLARDEAALAVPVVRTDLPEAERLRMLERAVSIPAADRSDVMAEIAADADRRWRSPWLQECAVFAASVA